MYFQLFGSAIMGISGALVSVQADVAKGLPAFSVVGLPDSSVKEAEKRVRAAIRNSGFEFPNRRITINLSPANVPKAGSRFDLPIALAILGASGQIASRELPFGIVGELALDGSVRPVTGVLPMALACREAKLQGLIFPAENAVEVPELPGLKSLPVSTLRQAFDICTGNGYRPPRIPAATANQPTVERQPALDNVVGQERAKRAILLAAAGGHSLLMVGPPGCGKTMLAACASAIIPDLSPEESLEVTAIHSACGNLPMGSGLIFRPPFRSPHHTTSVQALIGGGRFPRPGEITLAHRGILFLDELPEFKRDALEALRQPWEEGCVRIARKEFSLTFPCEFLLIAAMNPCPCGGTGTKCRCTPSQIRHYRSKVSGPFLDRVDMLVEMEPSPEDQNSDWRQDYSEWRKLAAQARLRQAERSEVTGVTLNSRMGVRGLERCGISQEAWSVLQETCSRFGSSMRAYHRAAKLARTIADVEGSPVVTRIHVAEAIQYWRPQARSFT